MLIPKDIVCLIPTWITARHAVGAADSLRKFYPDIPVYFVDDRVDKEGINEWKAIYHRGHDSFDPDPKKLIEYPNSAYILKDHTVGESTGHGLAITHAMQFIHAKWVIHLSTDTRIINPGALEYLFKDVTDTFCGSGDDWTRSGTPALASWLFAFRGDLYHEYNLDFKADRDNLCDIGTNYYSKLIEKGLIFNNHLSILDNFLIHLQSTRSGNEKMWDKYY